ncbi:Uncharacterised protein [Mycobacteroides abscessus subsp. abscessus]|nr:Uncharacterised protein [Mycobacteroides abscessus subsp. abscessus]
MYATPAASAPSAMPRYRCAKISWLNSARRPSRRSRDPSSPEYASSPVSTSSWRSRTLSNSTLPLAVSRCPRLSQSSLNRSPSRSLGMIALMGSAS